MKWFDIQEGLDNADWPYEQKPRPQNHMSVGNQLVQDYDRQLVKEQMPKSVAYV